MSNLITERTSLKIAGVTSCPKAMRLEQEMADKILTQMKWSLLTCGITNQHGNNIVGTEFGSSY